MRCSVTTFRAIVQSGLSESGSLSASLPCSPLQMDLSAGLATSVIGVGGVGWGGVGWGGVAWF